MIVDDDDKGCALRTARHAQRAVLRCGCYPPVDADGNNRKGRGHEKNREGSLHQTWRRVRSRFMLELPTGTLWSTVFEHPFIIHVRHAPTHTPGSRSQGIVIPRTNHVSMDTGVPTTHCFATMCYSLAYQPGPVFFFSDTGPPTQEHQIICQAEDAAGPFARPFAHAVHHGLVQLNHLELASYTPTAHLML